ncbi:MAG: hypothetical protein IPL26_24925 [Leptospiraceae bacterium]|nr:hypothetical protein [Leptospiraceae bacterium]
MKKILLIILVLLSISMITVFAQSPTPKQEPKKEKVKKQEPKKDNKEEPKEQKSKSSMKEEK